MLKSLLLIFAVTSALAQDVRIIKLAELEAIVNSDAPDIKVINFWATWCAPCVKELPYFEQLNEEKLEGIGVTLVSLDYADKLERVKSFAARKKIQSPIVILDETDYNSWIDRIEEKWTGALPATLIINTRTGKRKFVEKELHDGDLEKLIEDVN